MTTNKKKEPEEMSVFMTEEEQQALKTLCPTLAHAKIRSEGIQIHLHRKTLGVFEAGTLIKELFNLQMLYPELRPKDWPNDLGTGDIFVEGIVRDVKYADPEE